MPEPTDLEALAKERYGDERAAEVVATAANLQAGLRIVAEAALSGEDEPDFLDAAAGP